MNILTYVAVWTFCTLGIILSIIVTIRWIVQIALKDSNADEHRKMRLSITLNKDQDVRQGDFATKQAKRITCIERGLEQFLILFQSSLCEHSWQYNEKACPGEYDDRLKRRILRIHRTCTVCGLDEHTDVQKLPQKEQTALKTLGLLE